MMWTGQHLRPEKLCCECGTKLQPRSNRYQASSWRLSTLHFTYIYNMVIMCIFYFFFLFSFIHFSLCIYIYMYIYMYIYIRVSTDLSIDLSLYNTTETSPSDRFRNEAPAPRRATWESSLCLQQWPLGDSGLGVSIVMGAPQKWIFSAFDFNAV